MTARQHSASSGKGIGVAFIHRSSSRDSGFTARSPVTDLDGRKQVSVDSTISSNETEIPLRLELRHPAAGAARESHAALPARGDDMQANRAGDRPDEQHARVMAAHREPQRSVVAWLCKTAGEDRELVLGRGCAQALDLREIGGAGDRVGIRACAQDGEHLDPPQPSQRLRKFDPGRILGGDAARPGWLARLARP